MNNILQNIYEGSIYILTVSLTIAAIFFTAKATIEAYNAHYWQAVSALIAAAISFGIVTITSRFIVKEQ